MEIKCPQALMLQDSSSVQPRWDHTQLQEIGVIGMVDIQVPCGLSRAGSPWKLGGSMSLSILETY